ncbi:MAG: hypothetical protein ACOYNU_13785, partial [Bacteroidales bacterium]
FFTIHFQTNSSSESSNYYFPAIFGLSFAYLKFKIHLFPSPTEAMIEIWLDKEISGDFKTTQYPIQ